MIWSSTTGNHVKKWNRFSRQLFCYIITNMTIVTEKAVSKSQMSADFLFHKKIQSDNEIIVNWSSEPIKWFSVTCERPFSLFFPFTIESKRHVPDLFLNTNNPVISKIFGYNNNVKMGNRNCIYSVTLYNTKGNQE